MKIFEAKRHISRLRLFSAAIIAIALLFLFISGLKSLAWALSGDAGLFQQQASRLQGLIRSIYEKTQIFSWVWKVAPTANIQTLNSPGGYGLLFIVCCGALGRLIWDSASNLSKRVKKTILRVEEIGWEQSLLPQQGLGSGQKPDVLQINIDLQQKDQWYKRPSGLALIGIAIAVLGQWTNLMLGLVK